MDIAFLHPNYPGAEGSGAVHTATEIVTGLSKRGHNLTVYCPKTPGGDRLKKAPFEYRVISESAFKPHPYLHINSALRNCLDEFAAYDVFHSYLPRAIPAVGKISAETGTATVITLNSYGGVCRKNDLLYLGSEQCKTHNLARCASCVLQHSHEAAKYKLSDLANIWLTSRTEGWIDEIDRFQALAGHIGEKYAEFGFPTEKINVVPNVLDDNFRVTHSSSFTEPYRLLHVGRLQQSKGTDRLIKAFSELKARVNADCQLTVVGRGKGEFERTLRQQTEELGVAGDVTFEGHVDYESLPGIYAAHDLFVYPGRWNEPFGRVFLEAMATGTPVVSTDVGAVSSIVDDAGIVVDTNRRSLAAAISELLVPERLAALSRNGTRRAAAFDPAVVVPQFESLYAEAIAEAGSGAFHEDDRRSGEGKNRRDKNQSRPESHGQEDVSGKSQLESGSQPPKDSAGRTQ